MQQCMFIYSKAHSHLCQVLLSKHSDGIPVSFWISKCICIYRRLEEKDCGSFFMGSSSSDWDCWKLLTSWHIVTVLMDRGGACSAKLTLKKPEYSPVQSCGANEVNSLTGLWCCSLTLTATCQITSKSSVNDPHSNKTKATWTYRS